MKFDGFSPSLPPWISHRADKRVLISSTMRFTPFLAILPALAAAQEQVPLGDRVQGWFNKAKSYLPTATPVIPVAKVVEQKVQEKAVTPLLYTSLIGNLNPTTSLSIRAAMFNSNDHPGHPEHFEHPRG